MDKSTLKLVLKPWGALAVFAGIAGLFAATDPERYVGVVLGLIVLLCGRIYYRVVFWKDLLSTGGISPYRNRISVGVLLLFLVVFTGAIVDQFLLK